VSLPIYEYRCQNCGEVFTAVEHMDEHGRAEPRCPECESQQVQQVFAPFFAKTGKKS
jgi:putative FmdB family regulatory protein